jgi:hypothetical protein
MDEFDISEYLGGGFDTGGFNFDIADLGSLGNFDVGSFENSSIPDFGSIADMGSLGNFDVGSFDLDNILADLGQLGTSSGPSSSMGMDNNLLNLIGLDNLGSASFDTEFGSQGKGVDSLQKAIESSSARDFVANGGDEMDFGGTFEENMTRGQDGDMKDFGGTPAENIGKLQGQTTGAANYTTDAKGNVYKNGSLYRAAEVADDPKDPDNPYTRISTGNVDGPIKATPTPTPTPKAAPPTAKIDPKTGMPAKGMDPAMMMMLMLMLSQMGKGGGGGKSSQSVIPALTSNRSLLPYSTPSRPGAGGKTYFSPNTYTPSMADGGEVVMGGGGIASLGGYSDGGQLLKGPGDGVSDSIPATIGERQPARLADGEFVVPARIVSELGNGSTEAGARKLYAMMKRVENTRKGAKNIASNTKSDRHLPA